MPRRESERERERQPSIGVCLLRYDFKPASADREGAGSLSLDARSGKVQKRERERERGRERERERDTETEREKAPVTSSAAVCFALPLSIRGMRSCSQDQRTQASLQLPHTAPGVPSLQFAGSYEPLSEGNDCIASFDGRQWRLELVVSQCRNLRCVPAAVASRGPCTKAELEVLHRATRAEPPTSFC